MKWADALESGRYHQLRGRLMEPTRSSRLDSWGACVIGVAILELAPPRYIADIIGHPGPEIGVLPALGISHQTQGEIAKLICRQTGVGPEACISSLIYLNDKVGIGFTQFARAIRMLVWQREQQEEGVETEGKGSESQTEPQRYPDDLPVPTVTFTLSQMYVGPDTSQMTLTYHPLFVGWEAGSVETKELVTA